MKKIRIYTIDRKDCRCTAHTDVAYKERSCEISVPGIMKALQSPSWVKISVTIEEKEKIYSKLMRVYETLIISGSLEDLIKNNLDDYEELVIAAARKVEPGQGTVERVKSMLSNKHVDMEEIGRALGYTKKYGMEKNIFVDYYYENLFIYVCQGLDLNVKIIPDINLVSKILEAKLKIERENKEIRNAKI